MYKKGPRYCRFASTNKAKLIEQGEKEGVFKDYLTPVNNQYSRLSAKYIQFGIYLYKIVFLQCFNSDLFSKIDLVYYRSKS